MWLSMSLGEDSAGQLPHCTSVLAVKDKTWTMQPSSTASF
jgi:hypothetical protein